MTVERPHMINHEIEDGLMRGTIKELLVKNVSSDEINEIVLLCGKINHENGNGRRLIGYSIVVNTGKARLTATTDILPPRLANLVEALKASNLEFTAAN
jgi:hypothetical protein